MYDGLDVRWKDGVKGAIDRLGLNSSERRLWLDEIFRVIKLFETGNKTAITISPCGYGKSEIVKILATVLSARDSGFAQRVVLSVPNTFLLDQLKASFEKAGIAFTAVELAR